MISRWKYQYKWAYISIYQFMILNHFLFNKDVQVGLVGNKGSYRFGSFFWMNMQQRTACTCMHVHVPVAIVATGMQRDVT